MKDSETARLRPEQPAKTIGPWRLARKIAPLLVAVISVFAGALVLAGWALDITVFKNIFPGWMSMTANSALGFILAGAALLAASLPSSSPALRLARLCALLCGLIGLLTLGEYLFAWNPGFDQWLYANPADIPGAPHPSRMAPETAACFLFLAAGLTLLCAARKSTMKFWFTAIFNSLAMSLALAALLAYVSKDICILGWGGTHLMTASSATLFALLGAAILLRAWPQELSLWSASGKSAMGLIFWSMIMCGSLSWSLHQQEHHLLESATIAARANIKKDLSFRRWATSHGGVYVPPTGRTPPNPYLKVPDRDVVTTAGKPLTLMNPAYMLREMQQNFGDEYGARSRITSLKPLNPANSPDAWQTKALSYFAQGGKELQEMQDLDGQPYLRLMQPFLVEEGCLKCHAHQGYKLGDVRGGIDTSIPLAPFLERSRTNNAVLTLSHAAIWFLGISGMLLFYRREEYLDAENQKSLAALHDSEQRFRQIIKLAPLPMAVVDNRGELLFFNDRFAQIFGYTHEEIPTLNQWWRLAYPDEHYRLWARQTWAEAVEHAAREGRDIEPIEYNVTCKNGEVRVMSISGIVYEDNVLATFFDITERKLAEEEKEKLESQLRQAQKMEAIGTLAGGIAHDFNNILSIIFGYNELAMEEQDPENRHHQLEELKNGAERAKQLVAQILAFSRKAEQQKQPLQVSLIIKEALKMLRASIPSTIEFRQNITSTGMVLADPTQIHQLIMNLCTNAYHAMRETGGILGVSLGEVAIAPEDYGHANLAPGNYLKLEVSDTGCGIDPKIQEKIFEPYFTTKKAGEGTGLGLAVVHGIVTSHHGQITVYSEQGKGTSFHVYLPLTEQEAVPAPEKTAVRELRGKGERVLLVDDEEPIRAVVDAMLSKNGYQVTSFADGRQALAEFQKEPDRFALVITDLTMPSMTGMELARNILALRPRTPLILCTGQSELLNREKAIAMGIREYLNKPIPMETLLEAARKALEHGGSPLDHGQGA